jgi:hypothetical protein
MRRYCSLTRVRWLENTGQQARKHRSGNVCAGLRMLERGLLPDFSSAVLAETRRIAHGAREDRPSTS